jgi:hypothetical protein
VTTGETISTRPDGMEPTDRVRRPQRRTIGMLIDRNEVVPGASGDEVAAATRPANAPRYQPWWKVWLPIPLLFVLFDATFNFYFWQVPKLTGTADDYSYQFLYDLHDLQTHRPEGVRVLAFGSSVTSALDPYQIDGLLERAFPEQPVEVRRILRPGTKPSDYHLLWASELEPVDPDVMVAVFNLVDFINPSFERNLKPGIRYILPPWETLLARYEYIPQVSEKVEMLLASVSNLYRYRKPIRSMLRDHVKLLRTWVRGGGGAPYGIYDDGFTKARFGVRAAPEIEYFVDPAWIEQRGRARVTFEYGGRVVARDEWSEPGWKRVALDLPARADGVVNGSVEGGWTPRASRRGKDARILGVRLAEPPSGENLEKRRPPPRYPPVLATDLEPFLRMGTSLGDEYAEKWRQTVAASTEFGKRFRLYRDAKLERARQIFEPNAEFLELREMVESIAASGRRVVMVNTPESPLLEGVVDSEFYADYLAFFESIAAADPRVTFIDLHDELPAEDLNDWHHLNYVGQMKLGPVLARRLEPVVAAALSERAARQAGGA